MSLSNYSQIKSAIADYLNRVGQVELEARAGDFVLLFESQFDKQDIRHPLSVVRATTPLLDEYTVLPVDFAEMQRLRTAGSARGWSTHRYVTPEELEDDKASNTTDRPSLFTVVGSDIQIKPWSGGEPGLKLEMIYWAKLRKLSDSEPSNWLLREAPEAYLFGALTEAAPFIRDDERISVWQSKRDFAVSSLRSAAERAMLTSGTLKPRRRKLG